MQYLLRNNQFGKILKQDTHFAILIVILIFVYNTKFIIITIKNRYISDVSQQLQVFSIISQSYRQIQFANVCSYFSKKYQNLNQSVASHNENFSQFLTIKIKFEILAEKHRYTKFSPRKSSIRLLKRVNGNDLPIFQLKSHFLHE